MQTQENIYSSYCRVIELWDPFCFLLYNFIIKKIVEELTWPYIMFLSCSVWSFPWQTILSRTLTVNSGAAEFFHQEPESKLIRLCGPYHLRCTCPVLLCCTAKAGTDSMSASGHGCILMHFIYKIRQVCVSPWP